MKTYLEDVPKHYNKILDFFNDGNISDNEIEVCYSILSNPKYTYYKKLKSTLLNSILTHSHIYNENLLVENLNITGEDCKLLKNAEKKYASFPIISPDKKNNLEIANVGLYDIELKSDILTFPNESVTVHEALNAVAEACGRKFFVTFNKDFSGASFSLSVAAAILLQYEKLQHFVFTGDVRSNGAVIHVNNIKEKKEFTHERKYYLVSPESINNISKLKKLNSDKIDLPFIQLFNKKETELFRNFNNICKAGKVDELDMWLDIFELNYDDISVFSESEIKNELDVWDKLLNNFQIKLSTILHLPYNINIHFLGSLSVFAFLSGIICGAKNKITVYHYQDSSIHKVMNFKEKSTRLLKQKANKYLNINYNIEFTEAESEEVAIAIYVASHNPKYETQKYIKRNLKCSMLFICLQENQGNIELSEDCWINTIAEIYTVIDEVGEIIGKNIKKYHFFMSIPVPVAFGLGMAFGDYKSIAVYNYEKNKNTYKKVADSVFSKNIKMIF